MYALWTVNYILKQINETQPLLLVVPATAVVLLFFLFFDPILEPLPGPLACTVCWDGWPKRLAGWPERVAGWLEKLVVSAEGVASWLEELAGWAEAFPAENCKQYKQSN